jgi:hypothetical protein
MKAKRDSGSGGNEGAGAGAGARGCAGDFAGWVGKGMEHNFVRTIGVGVTGTVKIAKRGAGAGGERFCAVKQIPKGELTSENQARRVVDERECLLTLEHPFLIACFGTCQDERNLYLMMEFAAGGELFSQIHKRPGKSLGTEEAKFYAVEVLSALEYIHRQRIVYRDLKVARAPLRPPPRHSAHATAHATALPHTLPRRLAHALSHKLARAVERSKRSQPRVLRHRHSALAPAASCTAITPRHCHCRDTAIPLPSRRTCFWTTRATSRSSTSASRSGPRETGTATRRWATALKWLCNGSLMAL